MSKKGLLLGSILADAFSLGAHWVYDCDKIKQNFGEYDSLNDPLPGSFHSNRKKGEHTHYGDQTLLLLEYFAEKRAFDREGFMRFWGERMEHYGGYMDHATKDTLQAISEGREWGSSSADLSGASRIAPVIYCNSDEERGIAAALGQTKVTHNNEKVLEAAEFFTRTAYKVLGGALPSEAMDEAARDMKAPFINKKLQSAKDHVNLGPVEAIGELGQSCTVDGALPATIYIILRYQEDYREAMKANVLAGGDSAARGLLAGMIIGAYKEESIPKEWLDEMCSLERVHF